jgi:ubiquinone/menaquinone biosynthesis C-methylase UbiE
LNQAIQVIEQRWNTHAHSYDNANLEYAGTAWMKVLEEQLPKDKSINIADVGAGTGFLALYAANLGYGACHCVDISAEMLKLAKEHAEEAKVELNYIQGPAEELTFEDNSVDVVMNRWLLWTLLDPLNSLSEWRRVLKTKGILLCFCTVSNKAASYAENAHYPEEVEAQLPLKNASKEQLIEALIQGGFEDVEAIAYPELFCSNPKQTTWYLIRGRKCV